MQLKATFITIGSILFTVASLSDALALPPRAESEGNDELGDTASLGAEDTALCVDGLCADVEAAPLRRRQGGKGNNNSSGADRVNEKGRFNEGNRGNNKPSGSRGKGGPNGGGNGGGNGNGNGNQRPASAARNQQNSRQGKNNNQASGSQRGKDNRNGKNNKNNSPSRNQQTNRQQAQRQGQRFTDPKHHHNNQNQPDSNQNQRLNEGRPNNEGQRKNTVGVILDSFSGGSNGRPRGLERPADAQFWDSITAQRQPDIAPTDELLFCVGQAAVDNSAAFVNAMRARGRTVRALSDVFGGQPFDNIRSQYTRAPDARDFVDQGVVSVKFAELAKKHRGKAHVLFSDAAAGDLPLARGSLFANFAANIATAPGSSLRSLSRWNVGTFQDKVASGGSEDVVWTEKQSPLSISPLDFNIRPVDVQNASTNSNASASDHAAAASQPLPTVSPTDNPTGSLDPAAPVDTVVPVGTAVSADPAASADTAVPGVPTESATLPIPTSPVLPVAGTVTAS